MLREASEQRARAYLLTFVSGLLWFGLGLLRVCIRYGSSLLRVCFGLVSGLLRVCMGLNCVCCGFVSVSLRTFFEFASDSIRVWMSSGLRSRLAARPWPRFGFPSGLHRVFLPEFPYHSVHRVCFGFASVFPSSFPTRVSLP